MSYTHILPWERVLIEEYRLVNKSISYIAKQLKRSKSTIKYELDRVCPYNALQAQMDYENKRENCGCKPMVDLDDIKYILVHLKKGWSPEMIVKRTQKTIRYKRFKYLPIRSSRTIPIVSKAPHP